MAPRSDPNRYRLRRIAADGRRDLEFYPGYAALDFAVAIAEDYAQPGVTIQVWDSDAKQVVAETSLLVGGTAVRTEHEDVPPRATDDDRDQ